MKIFVPGFQRLDIAEGDDDVYINASATTQWFIRRKVER